MAKQSTRYLGKQKAAAAAVARRHYRGLTWLGPLRRAGGAPVKDLYTMTLLKGIMLRELSLLDVAWTLQNFLLIPTDASFYWEALDMIKIS